jgi:hypothetical protein
MGRIGKSWIALLVSVAVLGSLTATAAVSSAGEGPPADIFDPGEARRAPHGSSAPAGDFAQGRGREREVTEMRTAESNTYLTADGSYETVIHPGVVNFKQDGQFRPIDNELVATGGGSGFTNKANAYRVHLPPALDGAPVRIEQDGYWVAFTLEGAHGRAVAQGSTASYVGLSLASMSRSLRRTKASKRT